LMSIPATVVFPVPPFPASAIENVIRFNFLSD
jgi:hypothetical protein